MNKQREYKELVQQAKELITEIEQQKSKPTQKQIEDLYLIYNLYYDLSEHNYDCWICYTRVFTRLKKLIK